MIIVIYTLMAGGFSACNTMKGARNNEVDGANAANDPSPYKVKETTNAAPWQITADTIISEGLRYIGTPYIFGAERFDDKAFDCSSYVQYLYGKQGILLGYNSREQAVQGEEIAFINLRKGDLMFFSDEDFPNETGLNKVRHVGIYMGEGKILHTYEEGTGVIISNIHKDEKEGEYWYQHYLFARRVISG